MLISPDMVLHPAGNLPRQLVPISPETALPHPVLNLRISPDSLQNYSNKPTTSTQVGYTTILLLQSLLPTAPADPLDSLVQPACFSTSHGLHVLLPGCEYMCQKTVSNLFCQVWSVTCSAILHYLGLDPSSTNKVKRRRPEQYIDSI